MQNNLEVTDNLDNTLQMSQILFFAIKNLPLTVNDVQESVALVQEYINDASQFASNQQNVRPLLESVLSNYSNLQKTFFSTSFV